MKTMEDSLDYMQVGEKVKRVGWESLKKWKLEVDKKNSALELRQRSSARPAPLFLFLAFVASTDRCIQERERENGIYLIHLL